MLLHVGFTCKHDQKKQYHSATFEKTTTRYSISSLYSIDFAFFIQQAQLPLVMKRVETGLWSHVVVEAAWLHLVLSPTLLLVPPPPPLPLLFLPTTGLFPLPTTPHCGAMLFVV
jgi:hypothetical protein